MRNFALVICILIASTLKGQSQNENYSIFNPTHMKKEFFMSTNSGVLNTPYGLKVGYLCNPGIYLGFRYGKGEIYNSETDFKTVSSDLYSATVGINKALIIKKDFKLVAQLGMGYGQWWDYRWESWTKSGYEIEAGLMIQKKRFLLNMTGNLLNGTKTYATGDFCLGIGYVFKTHD
jgi:hypothetical protein